MLNWRTRNRVITWAASPLFGDHRSARGRGDRFGIRRDGRIGRIFLKNKTIDLRARAAVEGGGAGASPPIALLRGLARGDHAVLIFRDQRGLRGIGRRRDCGMSLIESADGLLASLG